MANWLTKILPWGKGRAAEGQYRPGPYLLSNGWLPAGTPWNYWQSGQNVQPYGGPSAMVEACVSAYSQTIAMCPGDHWRKLDNGGRERVENSALARIMRRPNDYQSISDFHLNLTRRLYECGESFAVALRNNRGEISELHLMRHGSPSIAVDGSIFYSLHGNEILEQRIDLSYPVPAREVLHVRLHTPKHPLRGASPILAAALDLAMSGAAISQQVQFYLNQARPSFILETDRDLKQETIRDLRTWWEEMTTGENVGRTPIAAWGLKAKQVTVSPQDGQLAELLNYTNQHVALAYRMPLEIMGMGQANFASTEALMQAWIATGLGFAVNHIEEAYGQMFGLRGVPYEYVELDTKSLLRSAYKERIEGLARGVISGIYSPDEARAEEDLPRVPGGVGKEPRVQMQVVPLSYGADLKPPPLQQLNPPPTSAAPPAPATPPPAPAPTKAEDTAGDNSIDASVIRDLIAAANARHRRAA